MPPKDKYTDPKLREEVKEEIKQSDKGGEPGQWSARKAQMMAKEYKNRGGGYNQNKSHKDESQQHLTDWTNEEWETKEGDGEAKQADGSRKRYLPKEAWDRMDQDEKERTDKKKQKESKQGKQFVANTKGAKQARKNVSENGGHDDGEASTNKPRRSQRTMKNQANASQPQEQDGADQDEPPKKKSKTSNQKSSASAKSGTVGSKHDSAEAPAQSGSNKRLPKKGQKAYWKAMPGWVDGEVLEIVTTQKTIDGHQVKGTKDEPRIVLKSTKSGKTCVHKPDNCYFDD